MKRSVLDSFALLSYLQGEPHGEVVRDLLEQAKAGERQLFCCWVNLTEVYYTIARRLGNSRAAEVLLLLEELPLQFLPADRAISLQAAEIKRQFPLALGDAFAAGAARHLEADVVTGDPEFRHLADLVQIIWLA